LARLTGWEIQFGSGVSNRDEAKSIRRRQQYKNANPIPSERVGRGSQAIPFADGWRAPKIPRIAAIGPAASTAAAMPAPIAALPPSATRVATAPVYLSVTARSAFANSAREAS
jgi:hypothetical protein